MTINMETDVHLSQAVTKIYRFEGMDFLIWHDPRLGSFARLDDLCEIHKCGLPDEVLPKLDSRDVFEVLIDAPDWPEESLVGLDESAMETIRALAADWDVGVRFRTWLIDTVFAVPPHSTNENAYWARLRHDRAEFAAEGLLPGHDGYPSSAAEVRDRSWRLERFARSRPRAEIIAVPVGGRRL